MFDSLSTQELENQITELAAQIAADTCRWLLLVGEFDRREAHLDMGFHCCSAWLAWRCSVAPRAAREQVRVARRLAELPLVREAFACGELTYSKVRALTRVEESGVEADLLEMARCATAAQLERIVRAFRGVLDVEDARRAIERRYFDFSWEDDGSLSFRGRLAPEEGALLLRALEAGREMTNDRPPEGPPPGDPATANPDREDHAPCAGDGSEVRDGRGADGRAEDARPALPAAPRASTADAVVTMAESLLANGAGTRPAGERHQVVIHVDADTLAGETGAKDAKEGGSASGPGRIRPRGTGAASCCELENGPALSAETARRLSCDGSVVAMLEGPDGTLHVGRRTRAIPPSIRRALRSRDRGCRFPGCPNHRWIDGHHIEHWARGGETRLDNLVQLCRHHHAMVHEQGYTVEREASGTLVFRTPSGARLANSPPMRDGLHGGRGGSGQSQRGSAPRCGDRLAIGSIPLPADAGARMDLHLTVSCLMERTRPEGPNGPLLRPG